jgi:hypothetical protein
MTIQDHESRSLSPPQRTTARPVIVMLAFGHQYPGHPSKPVFNDHDANHQMNAGDGLIKLVNVTGVHDLLLL